MREQHSLSGAGRRRNRGRQPQCGRPWAAAAAAEASAAGAAAGLAVGAAAAGADLAVWPHACLVYDVPLHLS